MTADAPTILATSMGFAFRDRNEIDYEPGPIFPYAFELARASARPKLCFIGTATGDAVTDIATFYAAFAAHDVQVSHLALFAMPNVEDVRAHLLSHDVRSDDSSHLSPTGWAFFRTRTGCTTTPRNGVVRSFTI
jgi:hypothetical protein